MFRIDAQGLQIGINRLGGLTGLFVGDAQVVPRLVKFRIDAQGLLIGLDGLG